MFISHKNNVIQHIRDQEWNCRRMSKGMTMPEYWAWEETIKIQMVYLTTLVKLDIL